MLQLSNNSSSRCQDRNRIAPLPFLAFFLALLVSSGRLNAQVQTGINGTVVDSTGASIAGATVTVKEESTGVVTQGTKTSSAGTFVVIGLNPGHYSITVDATGFKRSIQTNVSVEIAKLSAVTFKLVPGSISQTVQVTSNEISLNTTAPEISTTLEPELVKTLPIEINGGPRVVDTFLSQIPESQNVGTSLGQGTYQFSGGQTTLTAPYINGVPVVVAADQTVGLTVPYEMIKEFTANVSTFSAQYGLSHGSVTYNTASGTNQLHGDAFDILRNSMFDSDGFFPVSFNAAGKPIPPINHQNDYGFTIGGPIFIPKLYNGRDRTFFLFTLDNYKENEAQLQFGTVPTPAMKAGDFSHFVDANDNVIPIYDPTTGQPFPGNKIPITRFSPLSQSLLQYMPDPNRTGTNFGLQNNEQPAIKSEPTNNDEFGFTLDQTISPRQSIHYSEAHTNSRYGYVVDGDTVPESNPLSDANTDSQIGDVFLANYVNTITPNLVATMGSDWVGYVKRNAGDRLGAGSLGVSFPAIASPVAFPGINFSGQNPVSTFGQGGVQGTQLESYRYQGFSLVNNWLWVRGNHTFNIGGEYRYSMGDVINCNGCTGVFNFSNHETSTPNPNDPNFNLYGSSFASFLLGDVDSAYRTNAIEMKMRAPDYSFYIQDNFRLNHRLTIDAGLRWDIAVPFHDANNNVVLFDADMPNPGAGGLPGATTKYGNCNGCTGTTHANTHWRNFGPRLGFSYMVNSKTVIQSGYYMAYLNDGAYNFGNSRVASVYSAVLAGTYYRNSTQTNVPSFGNWDSVQMPNPPLTPFTPSIANGGFIRLLDPKKAGTLPYAQEWNLSLQRQIPWQQFLTVAYIGNHLVHLTSALNQPNQLNPRYLALGTLLGQPVNSPAAVAAGIKIPYPNFLNDFGAAASVEQALLPYPQFGSIDNHFDMTGTTIYNSVMIQDEKRFTNGISYLASVTMARNMSNSDYGVASITNAPVNTFNQSLEWAPSTLDQKYNVKTAVTYELPIGIGQKYLHSNSLLAKLVGGWQVAGIMNYAGGLPGSLLENNDVVLGTSASGEGINRPDIVPGAPRKTYNYKRSIDYFMGRLTAQPVQFTTNAFTPSPQYGLGNTRRTYASLRTPPFRIEDFDAMKYFHITNTVILTLRMDYFNAFNRTQLQSPDFNISDSTFGMVTNQSSQISNRQGQATFRIEF